MFQVGSCSFNKDYYKLINEGKNIPIENVPIYYLIKYNKQINYLFNACIIYCLIFLGHEFGNIKSIIE